MHDTDEHYERIDAARRRELRLEQKKGESQDAALARNALRPELGATLALSAMHKKAGGAFDDMDLSTLHGELVRTTTDECATGTDRLLAQAVVLDKLFTHLTVVAMQQENVSGIAPALTLALKAQAQCRATLQAVSDIRHPRQYVVTQNVSEQYNAGGHQQVNRDGTGARDDRTHGTTSENRPTELSEGTTNELHPNGGAPAGVEGSRDADEAVGALDRTANG